MYQIKTKKRINKKAQFYIIAALIIIVVIFGISGITNYVAKKKAPVKIYDFSKELNLESEKVINYGIYNQNTQEVSQLLDDFSNKYGEHAALPNSEMYFIYGDLARATVAAHITRERGEISIIGAGGRIPMEIIGTQISRTQVTPDAGKVKIQIAESEYEFTLKKGENFFFVIQQEIGGEKHVTK